MTESPVTQIIEALGGSVAERDHEALGSAYDYAFRLTGLRDSATSMAATAYRRLLFSDRAGRPPRNRRAFLMASVNRQYLAPLARRVGW